jgi:acyl-CoA synthetase (NDP forming)
VNRSQLRRGVYSHADLKRLINPQSVAIVGLSRNETSFGARTALNLRAFTGRIYGVNPTATELHGIACVPTIDALPEIVDCVVLALPIGAVEQMVETCAAAGIGGCVIYASGFAETGIPERIALQSRLAAIARASSLRIVGPNVFGLINNVSKAGLTFSSGYGARLPPAGPVALVSQSGGLGQAIAQVSERGGAYSHFLAAGNSCDVDVCDYVSYLAEEPSCGVIACVAEGIQDGERLIEAGERALQAGKPLVMYKIATGREAAHAAMSHTGTLAGANAAYEAAYRRLRIVSVDNLEDVYETASFLAKAGRPRARGVAAIAASGGACVIALDMAERCGVEMPPPGADTQTVLNANVPDFGNPSNPCDITAQVATNPESYATCAEALLADPGYASLVVMAPSIIPGITPRNVAMFAELAERAGKPVCISWMSEWKDGPGAADCEANPYVARFQSTERAFRALSRWQAREAALAGPAPRSRLPAPHRGSAEARRLMRQVGTRLSERESRAVLAAYGVPVARDVVVQNEAAAAAAAADIGYPVVLKIESADIPHKTDAGVVRLALPDEAAVRVAYRAINEAAARLDPAPRVAGVLVQPMIQGGVEIVVGAKCDPTFGPMVVVGLGGVMVELLADSTTELAPVSHEQALAMIHRLRGAPLLTGFRGSAASDIGRLAQIIVAVSELAADQADMISEIDVNPVLCRPHHVIAVDALIVRRVDDNANEHRQQPGKE